MERGPNDTRPEGPTALPAEPGEARAGTVPRRPIGLPSGQVGFVGLVLRQLVQLFGWRDVPPAERRARRPQPPPPGDVAIELTGTPPRVIHLPAGVERPESPKMGPITGGGTLIALIGCGVLAAAGIAALLLLAIQRTEPVSRWAYTALTLDFLLSTVQAMPALALLSRATTGYWGIPLRRIADLGVVASLVTTALFILLLAEVPHRVRWASTWNGWPLGGALVWDTLALVLEIVAGLGLLYFAAQPDLAELRDDTHRGRTLGRNAFVGKFGGRWMGTVRRWQVPTLGVTTLGAYYFGIYVYLHYLLTSDLLMSLVPGWHSSDIPPWHVISGVEGGVASAVLALALLRRLGGLERWIGRDVFHACGKLLLALSLLFLYFFWAEFLTYWYGRTPGEIWLLALLMFGPTFVPLVIALCCCFALPFLLLLWGPIRHSVAGPVAASAIIVVGLYFDRIRNYVPAWTQQLPLGTPTPGYHLEFVAPVPFFRYPNWLDVGVMVGAPAAVAFLYLLALYFLPPISLWEFKLDRMLRFSRPYLKKSEATVVAKP